MYYKSCQTELAFNILLVYFSSFFHSTNLTRLPFNLSFLKTGKKKKEIKIIVDFLFYSKL